MGAVKQCQIEEHEREYIEDLGSKYPGMSLDEAELMEAFYHALEKDD